MKLYFHKYQGTGNDFILIDDQTLEFPVSAALIERLCDRKFGIGADGLILIQDHEELDYKMIYFNSDGSQSLCGNGSRCGFTFARDLNLVDKKATFETTDGVHQIKLEKGLIHFQLFDVSNSKKLSEKEWYLNTGSPHHIVLSESLNELDLRQAGRQIRYAKSYSGQNGTNVNFAQLLPDRVKIRTYERGVEDETLSCGTGATAVGLLAGNLGYKSPVIVETKGGELKIFFEKGNDKFTNIWLAGPAEKVFSGSITI
ncbi:MAG: diaminopimelate epimerase [Ekhidna sp.]|nr:diaminopimelate epimerase [Ekhidna sp.]MBC6410949.1 diaminopimelate epimerase [Ekhidna sp.]MBC6426451.1 diaminopimelate epimerase [Ekhidna sp.]